MALTHYQNRIDNLIQWQETPPGSFFYMPQNVSSAEIKGWTLVYDGRVTDYALHASLDALDARDTGSGLQLLRRARSTGNASAARKFGNWNVSAEVQVVGERFNDVANTQRLGGYALANLQAGYVLTREWSLFARANNIFDKHYEQVASYATPGANVFLGIRYAPKPAD